MIDFLKCPCSGRTLDKLIQPAILAVLSEEPSHGYRIAERIGEITKFGGMKPDVSGVYRFLKRMESRKLVVASWDTPAKGHAKRLYAMTTAGRTCLAHWIETLESHRAQIDALLTILKPDGKTPTSDTSRKSNRRKGMTQTHRQRRTPTQAPRKN